MMKKLLAFALVLGLCSLASAAVQYDLSLNGRTDIDRIVILPSEVVKIDVHATYGPTDGPDDFWVGASGPGEYYWGTVVIGEGAGSTLELSDGGYGPEWVYGAYNQVPAPGSWADGMVFSIDFHCLGEGNVDVSLYDPTGYIVIDTATIVQLPEPTTLALLGLGGLLLRRRK